MRRRGLATDVVDGQIVTGRPDVQRHAAAHDPQSDESDSHVGLLPDACRDSAGTRSLSQNVRQWGSIQRPATRTPGVGVRYGAMARMTGGEALVKQLQREGTRVVFGLPGVQIYGVMAALRDEKPIRFIATRHQEAIGYMADRYARAGGGYGVGRVVPGPGLLNTTAGLSTAYAASSPVLMISGQVPRAQIGKDVGVLHEINDQLDAIAPITKWRKRV